jgi:hypothetical protein
MRQLVTISAAIAIVERCDGRTEVHDTGHGGNWSMFAPVSSRSQCLAALTGSAQTRAALRGLLPTFPSSVTEVVNVPKSVRHSPLCPNLKFAPAEPELLSQEPLRPGQCRPRHAGAADMARAQEHPAHGALYRAGAGSRISGSRTPHDHTFGLMLLKKLLMRSVEPSDQLVRAFSVPLFVAAG